MTPTLRVRLSAAKPIRAATPGSRAPSAAYQPLDPELTALAALTSAADTIPYFTGSATAALATLTAFGRSVIAAADAAGVRTLLGLGSLALASTVTASQISDSTVAGRTLLTAADAAAQRTALGLTDLATLANGTAGRLLVAGASAPAWSDAGLSYAGGALTHVGAGGISSRQAATQDGIALLGRAGGTSSYTGTITTAALTGSRTYTFPDAAITVAGSASALTSGRVPFVTTGGLLTDSTGLLFDGISLTTARIAASGAVSAGTYAFEVIANNAVDRSLARFGISGITNGFTIGFTQSTGAIAYSFLGGTGAAGSATFAVPVTVPNGTAAAPGIRTTTYAHGLYSINSTTLGLAVAGTAAVALTSTFLTITGASTSSINGLSTLRSDASTGIYINACGTTAVSTVFGSSRANTTEILTIGAQTALKIGNNTADIPIKFGGGTVEFAEFTNSTLATGAFLVKYTTASTSTATGALVVSGGGGFNGRVSATEFASGTTKVVGAQGAAVADASGGATVDAEARTAINTLLGRLRTHGLIAT